MATVPVSSPCHDCKYKKYLSPDVGMGEYLIPYCAKTRLTLDDYTLSLFKTCQYFDKAPYML